MPNRSRHARWGFAAVGIGLLTIAAVAPRQGKTSSLGGTWKYSAEKSALADREAKDPKLQKARRSGGGRIRSGTSISGSGGDDAPSPPSGGGGGASPRGSMGPLGLYARPLPQLVIVQTDSTVTMTDPSGTPRTYRTNGKKEFEPLIGADTLEITAKWKDGKLTTERKLGSFGTIREVITLDAEAHELMVEVRLSGGQLSQPIDLVRVYDAAPGS